MIPTNAVRGREASIAGGGQDDASFVSSITPPPPIITARQAATTIPPVATAIFKLFFIKISGFAGAQMRRERLKAETSASKPASSMLVSMPQPQKTFPSLSREIET